MNEEKQPQEVSTPPKAQTTLIEKHRQLQQETTEREIQQQPQSTSEADNLLNGPTDYNSVQHSQYVNNYECDTNHAQYEEEECNYDDDDYDTPEDDDYYNDEYTRIDISKTNNLYSIIYAEPSWKYDQSIEELLKLSVERVADENCALFLWVNEARLPEALNVINQ